MVIDAHVHLYSAEINADPAGWADAHGERHWSLLSTRVRKTGRPVQSFPSLKELLSAMDDAGVDRAVLQGWYWENASSCALQNDFSAQCVRQHPDRLAAAVAVQPRAGRDHVRREMSRARDAGFQAVGELSPHSQGYPIHDPAFEEVLGSAGGWRWPVNLHVTAADARPYPGMVPTPLADFEQLAKRFPGTDLILAHFGGASRVAERLKRFVNDPAVGTEALKASATNLGLTELANGGPLGGLTSASNAYFDSAAGPLSYGPEIWRRFPPGRVIFGSDFPLNSYPALDAEPSLRRFVEAVRAESGLAPGELSAVLGGTAKRWFAVKAAI